MKSNALKMKVLEENLNERMDLATAILRMALLIFQRVCNGAIKSHFERH